MVKLWVCYRSAFSMGGVVVDSKGEWKIKKEKNGTKELCRNLVLLLAVAACPLAAGTMYNPANGVEVSFDTTADSRMLLTVNVLWGLDFYGLAINFGQQQFNAPTLLQAQLNGQDVGGWQSLDLGNGVWGIANPYAQASTNQTLGLQAQSPLTMSYVFVFSGQAGFDWGNQSNSNWILQLLASTTNNQFGFQLTSTDAPEPATLFAVPVGLCVLLLLRRRNTALRKGGKA